MNLEAAIAEKHDVRAERRLRAERKAEAAVELLAAQARVSVARRAAIAHAGSPAPMKRIFGERLLFEIKNFNKWRAIAQEWGAM